MNKDLIWMTLLAPLALAAHDALASATAPTGAILLAAGASPLGPESSSPSGSMGSAGPSQGGTEARGGVGQPPSTTEGAQSQRPGSDVGGTSVPGTGGSGVVDEAPPDVDEAPPDGDEAPPDMGIPNIGPGDESGGEDSETAP